MINRNELTKILNETLQNSDNGHESLRVFDLDLPKSSSGILKVFLWKGREEGKPVGVTVDDCTWATRRFQSSPEVRKFQREGLRIEVSSPGIERRLSEAWHFEEATGERIELRYLDDERKTEVLDGVLASVESGCLEMRLSGEHLGRKVEMESVTEARVKVELPF